MKPEKIINLEPRSCDLCGGSDLEILYSYHRLVSTQNFNWVFEVNNRICRDCGFVFVSPVYNSSDLAEYYSDSYANFGNGDFDSAARIAFIESLPNQDRGSLVFLEIGSNNIGDFQEYLSHKYQYFSCELNQNTPKTWSSTANIENEKIDIVAHYFVLEHVTQPFEFMREAYRVLKLNGVMICEIPDINIYPNNPAALMLHEHVNHFSKSALVCLAESAGFVLIRTDDKCSRPFGFSAAFAKGTVKQGKKGSPDRDMYFLNKKLFENGMDLVRKYESNLLNEVGHFNGYMKSGDKVVLWVANGVTKDFTDMLGGSIDKVLVRIVDLNPKKEKFFSSVPVFEPDQEDAFIFEAKAIFIFSDYYAFSILEDIKVRFGKIFDAKHIHILHLNE